jgi:hypothetical protein
MEVIGKIEFLGADEQVSASFVKRDVVVTTDEQYPQSILIQFVQDKTDLLDTYKVGDEVEIGVNLRGRKWTNQQGEDKYFNTIQGWRIKKLSEGTGTAPATPAPAQPATQAKLVMIGKGLDHPYENWIKSGWNDDLLIKHGYAKLNSPAVPAPASAPATPSGDPDLPF